jgi:hypothetical protein
MRDLLLVGSIPLADANSVFEAVGALSPHLAWVPDGETGDRSNWTQWQGDVFQNAPALEVASIRMIQGGHPYPQFRLAKDKAPRDIALGPLGYAKAARESYEVFRGWRDRGAFRPGTRFQVSLPTPFAVVIPFFGADAANEIWPVYERKLFEELDEICQSIPNNDLAVQWDIACEIHRVLEVPGMPERFAVMDGIVRAANNVPPEVHLGIHLCYGDPGHKHIIEPKSVGLMVDMSNPLAQEINRPINWLHMPVPRDRDDDAYFEPLRRLKLRDGTKFFLGLIHLTDGLEGGKRRIATAARFHDNFGLATECGFGRRPPETIRDLIALHESVAKLN